MLISLKINNVALINSANIQFKNGFNVLSGETGAGKSIIIDSLNFVLGGRADKTLIKNGEDFARVEAVFEVDVENEHIINFFNLLNISPEDTVIINRFMSLQGKNDVKVNGETVTINMLKKLTSHLVDIHGQHEHQALLDIKNHLAMLDSLNKNDLDALITELNFKLNNLSNVNNLIHELGGIGADRQRNIDLLNYEINEIEMASINESEEDELKNEKINLQNYEKIYNSLTNSLQVLNLEDVNALTLIKQGSANLTNINQLNPTFENFYKRLQTCGYELEDICAEMSGYLSNVEYSENRINEIEERLEVYKSLKRKYGATYNEINVYLNNAKIKVQKLLNCEEELIRLNKSKNIILDQLYEIALNITKFRKDLAYNIENKVVQNLQELGMKSAQFKVCFENDYNRENIEEKITPRGADVLEFMFSANVGEPVKPLSKIISGGEMSRFMLAFKCVLHESEPYKTLVFDEIDAGIGGTVGTVVAEKMLKLSNFNQVICVTHLAQIACFASTNFKILKTESDGKTFTNIEMLSEEQKELEIARMLGASPNSEIGKLHARELIEKAKKVL